MLNWGRRMHKQATTVSLARRSLLHEWPRYLAAVFAVAFSGLLVFVQISLLLGMFGTVTTMVDHARADLWVLDASAPSFDLATEMPQRFGLALRSFAEVERVEGMIVTGGDWRTFNGGRVSVNLVGLDVSTSSLAFPDIIADTLRARLLEPRTALIDRSDSVKLGTAQGKGAEINGKRVWVAGQIFGFRTIGGATVFVSAETAREIMPPSEASAFSQGFGATQFLVKVRLTADIELVRRQIQEKIGPAVRLYTPAELSRVSQFYWLTESGAGAGFMFSTLLSLIVGIAITSQTLRAATLASLREYAALRALGAPVSALRAVALEQAFWVGMMGLCISFLLAFFVILAARFFDVAMVVTLWEIVGTAAFSLAIALVSGFTSLGPLLKTEPAELLR